MSATPIGMRHTRQRALIQRLIAEASGPLSVDELHARAQREMPRLGVATVYRTVKLLVQTQHAQAVVLPDGVTRYEGTHLGHHHHFSCRRCDQTFDIDVCPLSIPQGTTFPGGFVVEGHELTLYGTCPQCSEPLPVTGSV